MALCGDIRPAKCDVVYTQNGSLPGELIAALHFEPQFLVKKVRGQLKKPKKLILSWNKNIFSIYIWE